MRGGRRALAGLATIAVAAASIQLARAPGGVALAVQPSCANGVMAVSLGPDQPADQEVHTRLCLPGGRTPTTVQVLVHGCLYNSLYWDYPDPTAGSTRYSYVTAALQAGYATLSFDMVGNGASSHPASAQTTVDAGVWVIHQVVQAARTGGIVGPHGPIAFAQVIEVSHSFGTFFAWLETSRHHDVDGVIFTSATHHLAVSLTLLVAALGLYPAAFDPQFLGQHDLGYLTTQPGARYNDFYTPGSFDPAVLAYDEAHKDLMTDTEIAGFPGALTAPLDVRAPVLLVVGGGDPLFCGLAATDCSSAAAMVAQERPFYGPGTPSVDGYLLAGAGHSVDLMLNSGDWFAVARSWALSHVPPI